MGNYLGAAAVAASRMATTYTGGIDHPTVVPENFEPAEERSEEDRDQPES